MQHTTDFPNDRDATHPTLAVIRSTFDLEGRTYRIIWFRNVDMCVSLGGSLTRTAIEMTAQL